MADVVRVAVDSIQKDITKIITSREFKFSVIVITSFYLSKALARPAATYKYFRKKFFKLLRKIPSVKAKIEEEQEQIVNELKQENRKIKGEKINIIPEHGKSYSEVLNFLREARDFDNSKHGNNKISGCIYLGKDEHTEFTNQAYGMFSLSNPLHTDLFPNVRRYESEVIQMTARMLHGGPNVCGAMTSGGTESILMAVKAYRDWALEVKGISRPQLVVPITVHAAFDKACSYFGVRLVHVKLGPDYKVDLKAVRRAINRNTIAIVGSAPNFPHGIIDDIGGLARLAKKYKIGLHVDACLGGFVLPFIAQVPAFANEIPAFDFAVDGVTSMSADTHKYGYAPKGTSVVLFSNPELRRFMYFEACTWTGGIYGSPTMAGSRPGGLIVAAWASLVAIGRDGYIKYAQGIMEATRIMLHGIQAIDELYVCGEPKAMVIAFGYKEKPDYIYRVAAGMSERGWTLNSLQYPAAVHICVTARLIGEGERFVNDLRASVSEVVSSPEKYAKSSTVTMYGKASSIPDQSILGDTILRVLDTFLDE